MKRNTMLLFVVLTGIVFSAKTNSFTDAIFGTKSTAPVAHGAAPAGHHLNTVEFWQTVTNLLEKNGYDKNSEFYKHAESNLHRVQTLHSKGHHPKKHTQQVKKPAAKTAAQTEKEHEAFLKGKKSGEAHERRLLKKKAAAKNKTETKTPRKKRVKKVATEK